MHHFFVLENESEVNGISQNKFNFTDMKSILYFIALLVSQFLFANDGAFFARGNHLIPIQETDVTVQKEILTIKKVENSQIEVTVYYEFYNPKQAKKIKVGFEAFAPEGDVDGAPHGGEHPYMKYFTVRLNNKDLPYEVAYVSDSSYAKSGKVESIDLKTFNGNTEGNHIDFYYVYHFDAEFKKGLNIIQHTYTLDLSGGIEFNYFFEYVLTAANRWGNNQIDDFTLILDMGEFETFTVEKSFFNSLDEWAIEGVGKIENFLGTPNSLEPNDGVRFHIREGKAVFKKKNFKPQGEIFLYVRNYYVHIDADGIGYLPFSSYQPYDIFEYELEQGLEVSPAQKQVLRNLPFARRGYVFQSENLKNFYNGMDWYIPDPEYIPELKYLTEDDLQWIEKWE